MGSTMEVGVFLPTMHRADAPQLDVVAAARHAEAVGLSSIWAVDQLIAGRGVPFVESIVALSAAAGATSRIQLGLGTMVVPLRPVAWIAKQVASLQVVSGGRVLLGVGVGGDRHDLSWAAAGVPRRERGARTDAALAVLADLVAGRPAALPDQPGNPVVQLSPGVEVPPMFGGGMADVALRRAAQFTDGWLALPLAPHDTQLLVARLQDLRASFGGEPAQIIGSVMAALDDDPAVPSGEEIVRIVSDPDGVFGMPADVVLGTVLRGGIEVLAQRIEAWAAIGASRVVISVVAGDWFRQADLVAEAAALVAARSDR
ncbi:MAG: hypothetical protein JWM34_1982 [Ilumatobacteraceae bacterium]|nr:hypothetical protein [Ilumatobacteraceae bacterium]